MKRQGSVVTTLCACLASAFLAAPVLAFSPPAAGQTSALSTDARPSVIIGVATALFNDMDYDNALPLFEQAERHPAATKDEKTTVKVYRSFILIMHDEEILARDIITEIYKIDPDFTLPTSVSPKFREVFEDVKKDLKPTQHTKEAEPAVSGGQPTEQKLTGTVPEKPNVFVRFWPSWTCFAIGVGLLIPGIVIGVDANSGRDTLKNAPKDAAGRIPSMTYEDAKAIQSDAERNSLTANILFGAGGAALVTGVVMFLVYDGAKDITTKTSVSVETNGDTKLVKAAWVF